jgi:hypothetical protein
MREVFVDAAVGLPVAAASGAVRQAERQRPAEAGRCVLLWCALFRYEPHV